MFVFIVHLVTEQCSALLKHILDRTLVVQEMSKGVLEDNPLLGRKPDSHTGLCIEALEVGVHTESSCIVILNSRIDVVPSKLIMGKVNVYIIEELTLEEGGGTTFSLPYTLVLSSMLAEETVHLDIVTGNLNRVLGDTFIDLYLLSIFKRPTE